MLLSRKPGLRYVSRGVISAFDYEIGAFTGDGTWRTLDLSALVPKNAKLVCLKMLYAAPAAGRFFGLRASVATYTYNNYGIVTPVGGGQHENNFTIPIGIAQTIAYNLPAAGSTTANLIIQGWWV